MIDGCLHFANYDDALGVQCYEAITVKELAEETVYSATHRTSRYNDCMGRR